MRRVFGLRFLVEAWLPSRRERVGARHAPGTEPAGADMSPPGSAWNLWKLERTTRETAGADTARDEERCFVLMYLRDFADPDGMLPDTFDPLMRETFGDVLAAVRT